MVEETHRELEPQTDNRNLWKTVKEKWGSMTTAQKAYVGSIALLIGVNLADLATTTALNAIGGVEVGLTKPIFDVAGIAGFWLAKGVGLTTGLYLFDKLKSMAEKSDYPHKDYIASGTAIAASVITSVGPITGIAQLAIYHLTK